MRRTPAGRALPLLYFLLVGSAALVLAVVGAALDRLPLVPGAVGRGYQRGLLGLLSTLSRPLDGVADRRSEAPVGEAAAESSP